MLVVWDTQTGIVIGDVNTKYAGKIMFHGDQHTVALFQLDQYFSTYDTLNGTKLCQSEIPSFWGIGLGAQWIHKVTPQFAIHFKTKQYSRINIFELQPTSTSSLCVLSSFPVPLHEGEFSFSPVSFHGSFVTKTVILILDVRDSKLLLQTEVAQTDLPPPGQFSPDGCFFMCKTSEHEICVWQNTPTGYIPWSCFRPRLPPKGFLWSPTSISILCWCVGGFLLLHPDNHPNPLSPSRSKPNSQQADHLVAYSTDSIHIAMARQDNSVVTVLNCLAGTTQQFTHTDVQIQGIKIVDDTIFMVDKHRLVGWDLKAGREVDGGCNVREAIVNEILDIDASAEHLTLSHDCSQIAFIGGSGVFLYDIKAQKILKSIKRTMTPVDIRFSPDGCQLWFADITHIYAFNHVFAFNYQKLDMVGDWSPTKVTSGSPGGKCSWSNLFTSHGYHAKTGSGWVMDSDGNKLLWLPPNWRARVWKEERWEGNFLALVGGCNPVPIIIEFPP